jgi:hypothetical protein
MSVKDAVDVHNARFAKINSSAPGAGAFYENGSNFIYSDTERGARQLVKASVNSTAKTFITQKPIGNADSYPSIRNGTIVCQTTIGNQERIVILREDGGTLQRNSRRNDGGMESGDAYQINLGPGLQPSWHPSEDKIVFVMDGSIMEMNIYDTQQTQLYGVSSKEKQEGVTCVLPFYTGDGNHILFLKRAKVSSYKINKKEIPIFRWHLYMMDTDGSNVTELTSGNLDILHYGISKDNKIFFVSNAGGKTEIWSANIAMGE